LRRERVGTWWKKTFNDLYQIIMRKNDFAVIFDMDGVMVDSNPYHKIALKQFCEKHGYHLSDEELKNNIFGRTNKDWLISLFGETLTAEQITEYENEKEALFRKIYAPQLQPVAGLINFLKLLKENRISLALATSAPPSNIQFILEETGTFEFFSVILDGHSVRNSKPDPEIYLKTAAVLHYPPEKCVVIEDSISGVISARSAGCKVIGITTTHTRQELRQTHHNIDNFNDLNLRVLKNLFDYH
jgi:beta-phosphoglucomutase